MRMRVMWLAVAVVVVCSTGLGAGAQQTVVQHKGDLEIGSGEVVTIENVKYIQEGGIEIRSGGTLVVRHATLELAQDYDGEYPISVRGTGRLELDDVKFTRTYMKRIDGYDQGQISLSRVTGDGVQPWLYGRSSTTVSDSILLGVHLTDHARVRISRSTVENHIRIEVSSATPVVFRGLEPRHYDSLILPGESVLGGEQFGLTLDDTVVNGWAVQLRGGDEDATIEDSILHYVEMKLDGVTGSIQGLRAGLQAEWDSRLLQVKGEMPRVRLRNTTLTAGWSVILCGERPIEFSDCEFGNLILLDRVKLSLVDTTVQWFVESEHTGSVSFKRTWLDSFIHITNSQGAWRGDVRFARNEFQGGWNNSTIRRTYEVCVVDAAGKPVPGARVRVQEPGGGASREYTTNSEGRVEVELKFTDKTCLSAWTLSLPGYAGQQSVTFFTATPIVLTRKTP